MLKIKLARFGKKNQPHYRVVVNEARDKRDGSYVESIGHYAPTQTPKILEIDLEKFDAWVAKGAQPTDTVKQLAEKLRSGNPFPEKPAKLSKKAKAKQAEAAEVAEAAKNEAASAEKEEAATTQPEAEAKEDPADSSPEPSQEKTENNKQAATPEKDAPSEEKA